MIRRLLGERPAGEGETRGSAPTSRGTTTRNIVLALFITSFLVRAAFLISVTGVDYPLEGDEVAYHSVTSSFLRGDGWEDYAGRKSYLPPLISVQLLPVYAFTGTNPVAARWAMIFLSSFVAPVVFVLARKLLGGRVEVALLASAAWVLYPPAVYYAGRVLTENTAALLVVAGLVAFLSAANSRSVWPVLLTGTLWALATLNRPVFLLLPLVLLLAQVVLARLGALQWSWSWGRWGLALGASLVVMTPWAVHNYVEHRVFMPTHSAGGYVLLITNGTLSHPEIQSGKYYYRNPEHERILAQAKTEAEFDSTSRRLAVDEMRRNWRLLPRPVFNRAKNFWTPRPDPYDPSLTFNDVVMVLVWVPILVFFLTSSFTRSWRQSWPALVVILYAFLTTLPFWGSPRFRFPVDPLIIAGAALGLVEAWRWVSSLVKRTGTVGAPRKGV